MVEALPLTGDDGVNNHELLLLEAAAIPVTIVSEANVCFLVEQPAQAQPQSLGGLTGFEKDRRCTILLILPLGMAQSSGRCSKIARCLPENCKPPKPFMDTDS